MNKEENTEEPNEYLKKQIDYLHSLKRRKASYPEYIVWRSETRRFLGEFFDGESPELRHFSELNDLDKYKTYVKISEKSRVVYLEALKAILTIILTSLEEKAKKDQELLDMF